MHQPPQGESIWGTINTCVEIALNVYMIVAVDGQGIEREGVMVRKDAVKDTLSEKAADMGKEDGDWLCFDEDKKTSRCMRCCSGAWRCAGGWKLL